jgi:hypothetical protein
VASFIGFAHLVRRDVFLALGGYREDFVYLGEEKEFCLRLLDAATPRSTSPEPASLMFRTQPAETAPDTCVSPFGTIADRVLQRSVSAGRLDGAGALRALFPDATCLGHPRSLGMDLDCARVDARRGARRVQTPAGLSCNARQVAKPYASPIPYAAPAAASRGDDAA